MAAPPIAFVPDLDAVVDDTLHQSHGGSCPEKVSMSQSEIPNLRTMNVYGYHHSPSCNRIGKYLNLTLLWLDAASKLNEPGSFKTAVILGQMYAHTKPHAKSRLDPNPRASAFEASVADLQMFGIKGPTIRKGMKALQRAGLIELESRPGRPYIIRVLADDESMARFETEYQQRLESAVAPKWLPETVMRKKLAVLLQDIGFTAVDGTGWNYGEERLWLRSTAPESFKLSFRLADRSAMAARIQKKALARVEQRKNSQGEMLETGCWIVGPSTERALVHLESMLRDCFIEHRAEAG